MADKKTDSEINQTGASSGAASAKKAKENDSKTETPAAESQVESEKSEKSKPETPNDTYHRAKNSTEKIVGQALGKVKETAASIVDEQRGGLAAGIVGIAESVRQIGENVNHGEENQIAALAGSYGNNLADQIERISDYVESREITKIVGDVETFARRNPALFAGAAFALGVLAARFLKSSASRKNS